MINEKLAAKKRVRIHEKDDATMASYETLDCIQNQNQEDSSEESIDIDQPTSTSARDS